MSILFFDATKPLKRKNLAADSHLWIWIQR